MTTRQLRWWFAGMLFLAAGLRFYQLAAADVITDEALIGFRSLGYIDYFASPYQTSPWEWFSVMPWWAQLSFHDHPPLIFLLQHVFLMVFGENLIGLRLPFVLAGIGSVGLLYFIGKKMFSSSVGLLASLFLAVSCYHVWISRIGLQESIVIFLVLLTLYLFLLALDTNRHWQWGISLGLALLAKYTAVILLPIFLLYFLFFKRRIFKTRQFWFAIVLAVAIFSPVIIYNFNLFLARGHFDLQFAYLFGQSVAAWQFLPGKIQAGSMFGRLINLIPAIFAGLLLPIFVVFLISLILVVKKFKTNCFNQPLFLLILAIFFTIISLIIFGPSPRFVTVLVPFVSLLVAWFIVNQKKIIKILVVIILVGSELFFTINSLFLLKPIGWINLTYSAVRVDSQRWGYSQLNNYIENILVNKTPTVSFTARYNFLEQIKNQALQADKVLNKQPVSILLIYDNNMYDLATLWLFHRQLVYHGWPVVTADVFLEQGASFWQQQGIENYYFFKVIDQEILLRPVAEQTGAAQQLANQPIKHQSEIINRPDGRATFAVYNWQ